MELSHNEHNGELDDDLLEAVTLGQDLISTILDRASFEVVKAKIDADAPLWFQDDEGTSALHAAAYVGNPKIVRYLIEKGALWNAGELLIITRVHTFMFYDKWITCIIAQETLRCR